MGFKLQFPDPDDIPLRQADSTGVAGDCGLIEADRFSQGFEAECLILPDDAALDPGNFAEAVLE